MTVKLLTEHHLEFLSLKGGCTGSSESTPVKTPHCWKTHVAAQIEHMGLDLRKPVFWGFANNTGTDQPVHPRSLISAFVIRLLESIISRLDTREISVF